MLKLNHFLLPVRYCLLSFIVPLNRVLLLTRL